MKRLSRSDKQTAAAWLVKHPRKAARLERGLIKFIARIARKQGRRLRHRGSR